MEKSQPALVLIVEDEMLIALDLEMQIEMFGYRLTRYASSYDTALAVATETLPDIALIDGNLADGPTGVRIAEMLDERGVYCIAVSANPEIFAECECIGTFLNKPYEVGQLKAALRQAEATVASRRTGQGGEA